MAIAEGLRALGDRVGQAAQEFKMKRQAGATRAAELKAERRGFFREVANGTVRFAGAAVLATGIDRVVDSVSHTDEVVEAAGAEIDIGGIKFTGVPERVNVDNVDIAHGDFANRSGVAPHIFADGIDPNKGGGALLVGPDFGHTGSENPLGANPKGWNAMYDSKGAIKPFSPVSQTKVGWERAAQEVLPAGGFLLIKAPQMTIEATATDRHTTARMVAKDGNINFYAIRGPYIDPNKPRSTQNGMVRITDYIPGTVVINSYTPGIETGLGFVSEGQLMQMIAVALTTDTNCGFGGCPNIVVAGHDLNSNGVQVFTHSQERHTTLSAAKDAAGNNWTKSGSNF